MINRSLLSQLKGKTNVLKFIGVWVTLLDFPVEIHILLIFYSMSQLHALVYGPIIIIGMCLLAPVLASNRHNHFYWQSQQSIPAEPNNKMLFVLFCYLFVRE